MAGKKKSDSLPEITAEDPEIAIPAPAVMKVRNEVVVEPKIKFSTWFLIKSQEDARLKAHHADTIRAYIGSQGLGMEEPARRYDAALRTYFGA